MKRISIVLIIAVCASGCPGHVGWNGGIWQEGKQPLDYVTLLEIAGKLMSTDHRENLSAVGIGGKLADDMVFWWKTTLSAWKAAQALTSRSRPRDVKTAEIVNMYLDTKKGE